MMLEASSLLFRLSGGGGCHGGWMEFFRSGVAEGKC